jgi:hypothetical protein
VSDVKAFLTSTTVNFADGTTSTASAPRSGVVGRILDRVFGQQTVGDLFARNTAGTALADPRTNTIFIRPEAILNLTDKFLGATFHEVVHLLTRKTDAELMRNLQIGWFRGLFSGSEAISEDIKKKCFP